MKRFIAFMFFVFFSVSNIALADCVYDGKEYPPGTVIDGLTCQDDDSWK